MSWKTKRAWKKILAERRRKEFKKTDYQVFQSTMSKLRNELEEQKSKASKEHAEQSKKNKKKTIKQTAEEQMRESE